jgi:hypothetical protein
MKRSELTEGQVYYSNSGKDWERGHGYARKVRVVSVERFDDDRRWYDSKNAPKPEQHVSVVIDDETVRLPYRFWKRPASTNAGRNVLVQYLDAEGNPQARYGSGWGNKDRTAEDTLANSFALVPLASIRGEYESCKAKVNAYRQHNIEARERADAAYEDAKRRASDAVERITAAGFAMSLRYSTKAELDATDLERLADLLESKS